MDHISIFTRFTFPSCLNTTHVNLMIRCCVNTDLPPLKSGGCNAINLFCSSFPPLLRTRTFFAIPLAEKIHPFYPPIIIRKSSFPLSSLLQFLLLLNKYANYLYRRNWNRPVNPVRPCPWFYGGERQIVRLATPVLWLFPLTSQHFQFSNYFNFQILLEVVAIKRKNCRDGSR
jgi:hypothetical protein